MQTWRVLAWNTTQLSWTVRGTHASEVDARRHRDELRGRGLRARVLPHDTAPLAVKPPVVSELREWRLEQAGRMSDLADASKRYKSPG